MHEEASEDTTMSQHAGTHLWTNCLVAHYHQRSASLRIDIRGDVSIY